ncbi:hypothetical protein G6F70_006772 [Rhizopus microsporus]|nr:hypothetical protein G6F71_006747 [Rhizopus microsporus]KAG1197258.1 hypothetical protein G6F70_006772 [Rhizopus microsporus]KAG1211383.1 hypothetical protein G6F69_004648 [Rhizopus microsporus]KAG1233220.1 hypothetical protein G6F67_004424 [Rhizopus microsporus]KAG1265313.1 hypothetical protein G6F68_003675 [Rhizopus microsporus]
MGAPSRHYLCCHYNFTLPKLSLTQGCPVPSGHVLRGAAHCKVLLEDATVFPEFLTFKSDQKEDYLQPEYISEDDEEAGLSIITPAVDPSSLAMVHAVSNQNHLSYNDAVLQACQQLNVDDPEKIKILALIDALFLQPFSITNQKSVYQYALA